MALKNTDLEELGLLTENYHSNTSKLVIFHAISFESKTRVVDEWAKQYKQRDCILEYLPIANVRWGKLV